MEPALTVVELAELVRANLPPGPLWAPSDGDGLAGFAEGSAYELARLHALIASLLDEANPCRCDALLEDWLAVVALPDRCWQAAPATTDEAKEALRAYFTMRVGQRAAALEAHILRTLNLEVEFFTGHQLPFRADLSAADDVLWDEGDTFIFDVEHPSATAADALDRLKCFVNRFKPAHCVAHFVAV